MKHIKLYESFTKPVISYDFDGVLHRSVNGIHPTDFIHYQSWEPFEEMHQKMMEDAKDHDIVVVTARPPVFAIRQAVDAFIKMYDLPVQEVYYTDNQPKVATLKRIGAIKHYDDNPAMTNELTGTGIEFELIDPKLYEGVTLDKSTHETALKRNLEHAKENDFMVQGDYAVIFHGTSKKNMKAIQKSGMLKQGTWMSPDLDVAKKYSRQVTSRASDSIVDTFVVYLGSVVYTPNDEGGYFQSNEDLFYMEGKYVPKNFKHGGPDGLHEAVENMDRYRENGIVLLHGIELPDGTHKLYAANLKKVLSYQRMKMDGKEGQAAKMVLLYPDTYRITRTPDGKYKAGKVMAGNKMTGLKSRKVVLNNNKTPIHWETTKFQYFPMMFNNIGDLIGNIPNIKWYN